MKIEILTATLIMLLSSCVDQSQNINELNSVSLEKQFELPDTCGVIVGAYSLNDSAFVFTNAGSILKWNEIDSNPEIIQMNGNDSLNSKIINGILKNEDSLFIQVSDTNDEMMRIYLVNLNQRELSFYAKYNIDEISSVIWEGRMQGSKIYVSDKCEIGVLNEETRIISRTYKNPTACVASDVVKINDSTLVMKQNDRLVVSMRIENIQMQSIVDTVYSSLDSVDYIVLYANREGLPIGLFGDKAYSIRSEKLDKIANLPDYIGKNLSKQTMPQYLLNKTVICSENIVVIDSANTFTGFKINRNIHGFYGTESGSCFSNRNKLFYSNQNTIYRIPIL